MAATPEPLTGPWNVPSPSMATITRRRGRRRVILFLIAITAIAVLGTLSWRFLKPAVAVDFVTTPVTRGEITRSISASGTVNPQTTVQVGSYVSGSIQAILCDYNTQVKKGQLCATIDPRPYQTVVDQDQANLLAAQAQLEKDRVNANLLKVSLQRNEALFKQGLISQDEYDTAKATSDQAASQLQVDQSTIQQHDAALKAADVNLGYTRIVSPVDGTVVSRNVTIGQTVAASFQTPTLFLIATDLTKMQVDASVSEGDIGGVRQNAAATFTVEAYPGRRFSGTVTQVRQAPEAVQNVVTYDAVVTVANPELLLKPGMTANVHVVADHRDDVLRVPDQALRYTPGGVTANGSAKASSPAPSPSLFGFGRGVPTGRGAGGGGGGRGGQGAGSRGANHERAAGSDQSAGQVYVLKDGQPVAIPVTIGLDDGVNTEIVTGNLNEGDRVIVSESASGTKRSDD